VTDTLDDKSMMDDVFNNRGSDMGAPVAAPDAPPATPDTAPPSEPTEDAKPEQDVPEAASPQGRDPATGRFVPVSELVAERKKLKAQLEERDRLLNEAKARAETYEKQVEEIRRAVAQEQARQQQATQKPEEEPEPDFVLDPDGWARHRQKQIERQLERQAIDHHVNMSERFARLKHGDEVVDRALQAAYRAGVAAHFINHRDPFEALLAWERSVSVLEETKGDISNYRKQVESEVRQQVLEELKAKGAAGASQRFPTTLADQTSQRGDEVIPNGTDMMDDVFNSSKRRR